MEIRKLRASFKGHHTTGIDEDFKEIIPDMDMTAICTCDFRKVLIFYSWQERFQ